MTSKIKYQKNYTEFNETYQLVLPLSLEGFVPDDDSVRLLSHELEELDYTLLYKAYSSKGRNPASEISGAFPKVPGTAGNLRLAYGQLPGKEQLL